jgi:porin
MRFLAFSIALLTASVTFAEGTSSLTHQSGYENVSDFGGPEAVANQIRDADAIHPSLFRLEDVLAGYFDWKKGLKTRHGFATGTSLLMLYQRADESLTDDKEGAGFIFRWQGSWDLVGRDTGHQGGLRWRLENRSNMRSQSPSELGSATGAAALNPGFGYSAAFDWDLSVFNWTQGFADNRIGVAAGRLDFAAYLDAFAFQTFSRGFLNRSFLVNPTLGTTGVGALGAVARGMVTDQLWIGGGLYDANAASGEFDWDTIEEGEFLSHLEIGWSPSFARRGKDRLQLTWWHKDQRDAAGVPGGSGWAFSGSWELREGLLTFLRAGHSDGGAGVAAEDAISFGMQAALAGGSVLSLGAGWAKPNRRTYGSDVRDEYVVETSFKVRVTRNFSLLPNLQVLLDPAENPDEDTVVVFGLRAGIAL